MKRFGMKAVLVLGFVSVTSARASAADRLAADNAGTDKAAMAKGAPAADGNMKTEDCAAMMRSLVPLPAKFAELMTAVADDMDGHAAWVGSSKDKTAKAEAAAMKKLGKDHREVATQMKKIVADMEAGGKLAPAPHDMTKADPKMGERLMKQASLEREMAALMIKNADETDRMLKEMAKGGPAK